MSGTVRPRKSRSCRVAITTAIPAVNPVVTGKGTNSTSRPMPLTPIRTRRTPAIAVATSRPPSPNRDATGTSTATKAAVGPVTWTRDPPRRAVTVPATIAV
jgi:hypothetical protein